MIKKAPGTSQNSIKVGAMLSLSGKFALQGRQSYQGLSLWAEEVNDSGGIYLSGDDSSRWIDLQIYDDDSKSERAIVQAEKLILEDGANLLVGPYSSGLALAVAPIAEENRKIMWNHGGATDIVHKKGFDYIVSVLTPSGKYFHAILDMIAAHEPAARDLALVHAAKGTFASTVTEGSSSHASKIGFQLVYSGHYPSQEDDFLALLDEIHALQPDVVLGVGSFKQDLQLARQIISRRAQFKVVGLVAGAIQEFKNSLGETAEGFIGPSQWEPSSQYPSDIGPTSAEFAHRFQERFDSIPDYPAAQAYATGLIIQRCVEISGHVDNVQLRAAANQLDLTTFYGRFKIDAASGEQIGHSMTVIQWQNGQKNVIWPQDIAQAKPVIQ